MKFINRKQELKKFNQLIQENKSNLVVVYGKRRVGKTELIKHFLKKQNAIYYLVDKRPENEQLEQLAQRLGAFFKDRFIQENGFKQWYDFFSYLRFNLKKNNLGLSQKNPLVITFDEFPYLAEHNSAISSIFQKGWDEYLKDLPVYLILCGSSISMMEEHVLAQKAPLYGRRTGQLLIKPFSFYEAWQFYSKYSFCQFLQTFTITGGMPSYLLQLNKAGSIRKKVETEILDKNSFLFREIEFVLREELREPRRYLAILHAIAYNKTKFSQIVNETEIKATALYSYLDKLRDLQLIKKQIPITVDKPEKFRRSTYHLQDNFFKFWFTLVHPYRSELELGNKTQSLKKFDQTFNSMVAKVYESVALEIVRKNQVKFFDFERLGRWWNGQEEIDLVGLNQDENKILFGEVEWTKKPIGLSIYRSLMNKAKQVKWGNQDTQKFFCFFSKSGFTQELIDLSQKEKILLFTKDQLVS